MRGMNCAQLYRMMVSFFQAYRKKFSANNPKTLFHKGGGYATMKQNTKGMA